MNIEELRYLINPRICYCQPGGGDTSGTGGTGGTGGTAPGTASGSGPSQAAMAEAIAESVASGINSPAALGIAAGFEQQAMAAEQAFAAEQAAQAQAHQAQTSQVALEKGAPQPISQDFQLDMSKALPIPTNVTPPGTPSGSPPSQAQMADQIAATIISGENIPTALGYAIGKGAASVNIDSPLQQAIAKQDIDVAKAMMDMAFGKTGKGWDIDQATGRPTYGGRAVAAIVHDENGMPVAVFGSTPSGGGDSFAKKYKTSAQPQIQMKSYAGLTGDALMSALSADGFQGQALVDAFHTSPLESYGLPTRYNDADPGQYANRAILAAVFQEYGDVTPASIAKALASGKSVVMTDTGYQLSGASAEGSLNSNGMWVTKDSKGNEVISAPPLIASAKGFQSMTDSLLTEALRVGYEKGISAAKALGEMGYTNAATQLGGIALIAEIAADKIKQLTQERIAELQGKFPNTPLDQITNFVQSGIKTQNLENAVDEYLSAMDLNRGNIAEPTSESYKNYLALRKEAIADDITTPVGLQKFQNTIKTAVNNASGYALTNNLGLQGQVFRSSIGDFANNAAPGIALAINRGAVQDLVFRSPTDPFGSLVVWSPENKGKLESWASYNNRHPELGLGTKVEINILPIPSLIPQLISASEKGTLSELNREIERRVQEYVNNGTFTEDQAKEVLKQTKEAQGYQGETYTFEDGKVVSIKFPSGEKLSAKQLQEMYPNIPKSPTEAVVQAFEIRPSVQLITKDGDVIIDKTLKIGLGTPTPDDPIRALSLKRAESSKLFENSVKVTDFNVDRFTGDDGIEHVIIKFNTDKPSFGKVVLSLDGGGEFDVLENSHFVLNTEENTPVISNQDDSYPLVTSHTIDITNLVNSGIMKKGTAYIANIDLSEEDVGKSGWKENPYNTSYVPNAVYSVIPNSPVEYTPTRQQVYWQILSNYFTNPLDAKLGIEKGLYPSNIDIASIAMLKADNKELSNREATELGIAAPPPRLYSQTDTFDFYKSGNLEDAWRQYYAKYQIPLDMQQAIYDSKFKLFALPEEDKKNAFGGENMLGYHIQDVKPKTLTLEMSKEILYKKDIGEYHPVTLERIVAHEIAHDWFNYNLTLEQQKEFYRKVEQEYQTLKELNVDNGFTKAVENVWKLYDDEPQNYPTEVYARIFEDNGNTRPRYAPSEKYGVNPEIAKYYPSQVAEDIMSPIVKGGIQFDTSKENRVNKEKADYAFLEKDVDRNVAVLLSDDQLKQLVKSGLKEEDARHYASLGYTYNDIKQISEMSKIGARGEGFISQLGKEIPVEKPPYEAGITGRGELKVVEPIKEITFRQPSGFGEAALAEFQPQTVKVGTSKDIGGPLVVTKGFEKTDLSNMEGAWFEGKGKPIHSDEEVTIQYFIVKGKDGKAQEFWFKDPDKGWLTGDVGYDRQGRLAKLACSGTSCDLHWEDLKAGVEYLQKSNWKATEPIPTPTPAPTPSTTEEKPTEPTFVSQLGKEMPIQLPSLEGERGKLIALTEVAKPKEAVAVKEVIPSVVQAQTPEMLGMYKDIIAKAQLLDKDIHIPFAIAEGVVKPTEPTITPSTKDQKPSEGVLAFLDNYKTENKDNPDSPYYNLAKFIRDNPDGESKLKGIFEDKAIEDAKKWNEQSFVKKNPVEEWWDAVKAKGGDKLDMLQFKAFLAKNPDIREKAVVMLSKPMSAENQNAPVSLEAYVGEYMAVRGLKPIGLFSIADSKEQADARDLALISYRMTYGDNSVPASLAQTSAAFFFAPARALYPEVGIEKVTPLEWGIGALQLATLGYAAAARPLFGAIEASSPLMGSYLAKIAERGISTGLQGAFVGAGTVGLVGGWNDMTLGDKIVNVGLNSILLGSTVKPFINIKGNRQYSPIDTSAKGNINKVVEAVAGKEGDLTVEGKVEPIQTKEAKRQELYQALSEKGVKDPEGVAQRLDEGKATPEEIVDTHLRFGVPDSVIAKEFERNGIKDNPSTYIDDWYSARGLEQWNKELSDYRNGLRGESVYKAYPEEAANSLNKLAVSSGDEALGVTAKRAMNGELTTKEYKNFVQSAYKQLIGSEAPVKLLREYGQSYELLRRQIAQNEYVPKLIMEDTLKLNTEAMKKAGIPDDEITQILAGRMTDPMYRGVMRTVLEYGLNPEHKNLIPVERINSLVESAVADYRNYRDAIVGTSDVSRYWGRQMGEQPLEVVTGKEGMPSVIETGGEGKLALDAAERERVLVDRALEIPYLRDKAQMVRNGLLSKEERVQFFKDATRLTGLYPSTDLMPYYNTRIGVVETGKLRLQRIADITADIMATLGDKVAPSVERLNKLSADLSSEVNYFTNEAKIAAQRKGYQTLELANNVLSKANDVYEAVASKSWNKLESAGKTLKDFVVGYNKDYYTFRDVADAINTELQTARAASGWLVRQAGMELNAQYNGVQSKVQPALDKVNNNARTLIASTDWLANQASMELKAQYNEQKYKVNTAIENFGKVVQDIKNKTDQAKVVGQWLTDQVAMELEAKYNEQLLNVRNAINGLNRIADDILSKVSVQVSTVQAAGKWLGQQASMEMKAQYNTALNTITNITEPQIARARVAIGRIDAELQTAKAASEWVGNQIATELRARYNEQIFNMQAIIGDLNKVIGRIESQIKTAKAAGGWLTSQAEMELRAKYNEQVLKLNAVIEQLNMIANQINERINQQIQTAKAAGKFVAEQITMEMKAQYNTLLSDSQRAIKPMVDTVDKLANEAKSASTWLGSQVSSELQAQYNTALMNAREALGGISKVVDEINAQVQTAKMTGKWLTDQASMELQARYNEQLLRVQNAIDTLFAVAAQIKQYGGDKLAKVSANIREQIAVLNAYTQGTLKNFNEYARDIRERKPLGATALKRITLDDVARYYEDGYLINQENVASYRIIRGQMLNDMKKVIENTPNLKQRIENGTISSGELELVLGDVAPKDILRAEQQRLNNIQNQKYDSGSVINSLLVKEPIFIIEEKPVLRRSGTDIESVASEFNKYAQNRSYDLLEQKIAKIYAPSGKETWTQLERAANKINKNIDIDERMGRNHENEIAIVNNKSDDYVVDEGILKYEDTGEGLVIKSIKSLSSDSGKQRNYVRALAAQVIKKAIDEHRTIKISDKIDGYSDFTDVLRDVSFANVETIEPKISIKEINANWNKGRLSPYTGSNDIVIDSVLSGQRAIGAPDMVVTPEQMQKIKTNGLEYYRQEFEYDVTPQLLDSIKQSIKRGGLRPEALDEAQKSGKWYGEVDFVYNPEKVTIEDVKSLVNDWEKQGDLMYGKVPKGYSNAIEADIKLQIKVGKMLGYTDDDIAAGLRDNVIDIGDKGDIHNWSFDDIKKYAPEWYKSVTGKSLVSGGEAIVDKITFKFAEEEAPLPNKILVQRGTEIVERPISRSELMAIRARYQGEKISLRQTLDEMVYALKAGDKQLLVQAGKKLEMLGEGHPEVPGYMELVRQGRMLQSIPEQYLGLADMFKPKGDVPSAPPSDIINILKQNEQTLSKMIKEATEKGGKKLSPYEQRKLGKQAEEKAVDTLKKMRETERQLEPETKTQKKTKVATKTEVKVDVEQILKDLEATKEKLSIKQREAIERRIKEIQEEKLKIAEAERKLKEKQLTREEAEISVGLRKRATEVEVVPEWLRELRTRGKVAVSPLAETEPKSSPAPMPSISEQTQTLPYPKTKTLPLAMPKPEEKTKPQVSPMPSPQNQPKPSPSPSAQVKPQAEPKPQEKTQPLPKPQIVTKIITQEKQKVLPPILVKTKHGTRELSEKDRESAIAWKQGWAYKMIVRPYKQNDMITSKYPIPGVQYKEGLRSAYESATVLFGGEIPPHIQHDMGVVKVNIYRGENKTKPIMHFDEQFNKPKSQRHKHTKLPTNNTSIGSLR